jgi:hypothetical protein
MGKISTHLTLEEATASSWARRNGVDNSCTNPEHLENIKWIAKNIYDPIKTNFPNMMLEIAYRTPLVNKAVGGSANSQHMVGEAIDIDDRLERNAENKKVFDWVVKNLNFDQIIWELGDATGPAWLHISCKRGNVGNRKKVTRAIKEGTKTKYIPFQ